MNDNAFYLWLSAFLSGGLLFVFLDSWIRGISGAGTVVILGIIFAAASLTSLYLMVKESVERREVYINSIVAIERRIKTEMKEDK